MACIHGLMKGPVWPGKAVRKAKDWFIDGSALSTYRLKMDDCLIATLRVGLGRQWRGQIFPNDRVSREPVHLLWWKEKWPEVRIHIDSWVVGNGLEAWKKKKKRKSTDKGVLGRGMCMKMWEEVQVWRYLYHMLTPTRKHAPDTKQPSRQNGSANWY